MGFNWCFGKHDRAWAERDVYDKVRFMNDRGLERKFDIDEYVQRAAEEEHSEAPGGPMMAEEE